MSVIHQLLRRWGFVKLNAYGLVLTPEGRVMTTRPGVLDDGTGGRIVGWQEDDLAMAELRTWEPTQPGQLAAPAPAPVPVAAAPVAPSAPVRPAPAVTVRAPAAYPQVISESSVMANAVPVSASYSSVEVTAEPVAEEEDWEWTIAIARARAEAVDGASPPSAKPAVAAPPMKPAVKPSKPTPGKTTANMPIVPAKPSLASVVSAKPGLRAVDPSASGEWPKTAPIGDIDYVDPAHASTRTAIPVAAAPSSTARHAGTPPPPPPMVASTSAPRRGRPTTAPPPSLPRVVNTAPTPITVIPVPTLPTVTGATGRIEPVRTSVAADPSAARRLGKGTAPIAEPTSGATDLPAELAAMAEMSDDTSVDLSVGDRTTPGIAMPIAARAVQLPSVKRRAAQRS